MNFIFNVLLRGRTRNNIVRKTDDELTRYLKQTKIIRRKNEFITKMAEEEAAVSDKMNTAEIRQDHFDKLESLDATLYNKAKINDDQMTYDFLHKKEHYRPLGQRLRPFYMKPLYARREDFESTVGIRRHLVRILGGIFLIKLGYEFGKVDSVNEPLAKACVVDFETEE